MAGELVREARHEGEAHVARCDAGLDTPGGEEEQVWNGDLRLHRIGGTFRVRSGFRAALDAFWAVAGRQLLKSFEWTRCTAFTRSTTSTTSASGSARWLPATSGT